MNSNSNKSQFNEMMQGMSPEEEMDESDEYTDSESDENEDGFDLQKLLAPFGYIQREYFITNRVLGRIRLINANYRQQVQDMKIIGYGIDWIKITAPRIKEKIPSEESPTQPEKTDSVESLILSSDDETSEAQPTENQEV